MQSELTGYYVPQGFLNVKSHLKFNFGFWFDFHLLKCTTVSLWKESKMRINQKQELAEIFAFYTYFIDILWSMKWNWGIVTKIMLWFMSLTDTTFHQMKKYIVNCANRLIDWLIIYCFTSRRSRIFHLYGDVNCANRIVAIAMFSKLTVQSIWLLVKISLDC